MQLQKYVLRGVLCVSEFQQDIVEESNFETHIASKVVGSALNLQFLIQDCEGEARRLIEFCSILRPDQGYERA